MFKALLAEIWFERNPIFHEKARAWSDVMDTAKRNATAGCSLGQKFNDYSIQDLCLNWVVFLLVLWLICCWSSCTFNIPKLCRFAGFGKPIFSVFGLFLILVFFFRFIFYYFGCFALLYLDFLWSLDFLWDMMLALWGVNLVEMYGYASLSPPLPPPPLFMLLYYFYCIILLYFEFSINKEACLRFKKKP